ncbi:TIGR03086 family metal-binding protein [Rhodococcus sp. 105337]|uniref:TIGR03086 family metal-binding protein n=1 Tax=Rhodococcus sp. 105337 TaxID=2725310 RepID=UPI00146AE875|nr:TIGR03086 family metal-binding protein [Rhodococcus sp. 105337]NME81419.1 TIGR03086 family protein [Rhodococcus sp. 105337]
MANDWVSLQRTARREFDSRVAQITDWHAPTPDTEWDITTLVRHVVDEQRWVAPLLSGRTLEEAESALEPLGDDLAADWSAFSEQATEAWAATPADQEVQLSYGAVPCIDYLRQQVGDITVHAWDLARATGSDEQLDPALVDAVWKDLEPQSDMLAGSGLFADPVPVGDDASVQDRLLALTGRDPRRHGAS